MCVCSMKDVDSVRTGSFLFAAKGVGLVGMCVCACCGKVWELECGIVLAVDNFVSWMV